MRDYTARMVRLRHDALIALALALVLSLVWTARDWANLSILRLPDTDDVMRLQQVRDWVGGQAFGDLAQHRLGAGLPLHWSRLADLIPAVIIVAVTPLAGSHAAELTAVLIWPLLLFAAALLLVARIARAAGGDELASTAAVVAAIAYPATTVFLPGRIDHHGLQMVLLLAALLALGSRSAPGAGIAGLCFVASLIVGMEMMPLVALMAAFAVGQWIIGQDEAADRWLAALGAGVVTGLVVGRVIFAGSGWHYPACDGFTAIAWRAALITAAAPLLLAAVGRWCGGVVARAVAVVVIGGGAAALALAASPACVMNPYGGVDPRLARLWLAQVGEAQSVATAPLVTTIGYVGMMIAGLAATLWQWRRRRSAPWALLALLLFGACVISAVQLRGAYAGSLLAAPGLAAVIAAARRHGAAALAGAWMISAGMLYPLVAAALIPAGPAHAAVHGDCSSPQMMTTLATLPTGTVIAPIDTGSWAIAATRHHLLAAPYHRNNAGNWAIYAFYTGGAAQAAANADRAGAIYAIACDALPGADDRHSAAAALVRGTLPGFRKVARSADGATVYARERLSAGDRPH